MPETVLNGVSPVDDACEVTRVTVTPEQPGAIWNVPVATPPATATELFVTAWSAPGHWGEDGTPEVVRPGEPGAATGPPAEPDDPASVPPAPPPGGLAGGVSTGGAATGPGSDGGELTGFGAFGRGVFGLCVGTETGGRGSVFGWTCCTTAEIPAGGIDSCRTECAAALGCAPRAEWTRTETVGATSELPLTMAGRCGSTTVCSGGTVRNAWTQSSATPTAARQHNTTRRRDRMGGQ